MCSGVMEDRWGESLNCGLHTETYRDDQRLGGCDQFDFKKVAMEALTCFPLFQFQIVHSRFLTVKLSKI